MTRRQLNTRATTPPPQKRRRLCKVDESEAPADFQAFRKATVEKHPSLAFLGPASMAIYWLKTYLKGQFGWVHCVSPGQRDRRKASIFCHIPGQYLHKDRQGGGLTPEDVLRLGTAGTHYAPSYVGVYNLVRLYARFSRNEKGEVVLVEYCGPTLPAVDDLQTKTHSAPPM